MAQTITIVTFDPDTESATDQEVVVSVYDGAVGSSNFTDYENGVTPCPNGKYMMVESFDVSDEVYASLWTVNYGSGDSDAFTVTELKDSAGSDPFDTATVILDNTWTSPIGTSQPTGTEEYYVVETQTLNWNNITLIANGQHPEMTMELYNSTKTLVHTFTTTSGSYYESSATSIARGNGELVMPYYIKITYNEDSIYNSWTFSMS